MNPIESLRASHPAFRNVTRQNLTEYFALIIPQSLVHGYGLSDTLDIPPAAASMAGKLGEIMFQHFAKRQEDSELYFCVCNYLTDQVIATRDPEIHQVVILDMVMDARAYYQPELADCKVFEMNRTVVVLEEKERLLRESRAKLLAKERHVMFADPRKDGWQSVLLDRGFNPEEPTCWIVGSHLSYMTSPSGAHLVSVIASLSAPHSQICADMLSGHTVNLTQDAKHADSSMTVKGAAFFEMHGDNASVFQSLADWRVELLARRDANLNYFGTMWDPVKLAPWTITDPKVGYLGPWFMVRFSYPEAEQGQEQEYQ